MAEEDVKYGEVANDIGGDKVAEEGALTIVELLWIKPREVAMANSFQNKEKDGVVPLEAELL